MDEKKESYSSKDEFVGGIKNWAEDDRPREKLMQRGATALTDAEILAILIGSGNRELSAVGLAREILSKKGGINQLARCSIEELVQIKGIGEAKAISIKAAFELTNRRQRADALERKISSSTMAANYLASILQDSPTEIFYVLFLNRNNTIIAEKELSHGGVSSTVIDLKTLFREAVNVLATALIISHNHPSGNLEPSPEDIQITRRIKEAASLFDISLLDHIIVSFKGYYSFADNQRL